MVVDTAASLIDWEFLPANSPQAIGIATQLLLLLLLLLLLNSGGDKEV